MPADKTFLIKQKALDPITAIVLLEGLTNHMRRTANSLHEHKVGKAKGIDEDYEKLSTNLHKLAVDIETFIAKKGDKGGERRVVAIKQIGATP